MAKVPEGSWQKVGAAAAVVSVVLAAYFGFSSLGSHGGGAPSADTLSPRVSFSSSAAIHPTKLSPTAYLADLPPTNGTPPMLGLAEINGQAFPHSVYFDTMTGFQTVATTYSLNGQYTYFKTSLGVQADSIYTIRFEVLIDGQRVLDEVLGPSRSWPTSINIRGKRSLTIEETATGNIINGSSNGTTLSAIAIWGNARLVGGLTRSGP